MPGSADSKVIAAFANATRRRILELLCEGGMSVNALANRFDVARPAISRHLRVLREAGLVSYRAEHNSRIYMLDEPAMERLRGSFDEQFGDFWRPQGAAATEGEIAGVERLQRPGFEVRITTSLPIAPDLAYRYCTEETLFRQWVGPDATNSGEAGGVFSATSAFGGKLVGEYLAMEPGRFLALRVIEPLPPDDNLYTISFLPHGEGAKVELRHYVASEGVARLLMTAWYETWGRLRQHVLDCYGD